MQDSVIVERPMPPMLDWHSSTKDPETGMSAQVFQTRLGERLYCYDWDYGNAMPLPEEIFDRYPNRRIDVLSMELLRERLGRLHPPETLAAAYRAFPGWPKGESCKTNSAT